MEVRASGAPSKTRVTVIERIAGHALVECRPTTGRQHQIRAHLAFSGHPILGDKLYAHGDDAFANYCDHGLTQEALREFVLPRQALHATSIEFTHPTTASKVRVDAPFPTELAEFLDQKRSTV